ncbi:hypothetical protein HPB51_015912 [Rhipicephalus microplus]|uniref:Uncharacterized protein n=1 Tax=Rhipicephalus microplus TaxID=6941 RepID=A0A9J6DH24_RHIMP|nr:hypothetical protein HPB51_015912 [Rhipicephalus microplus]
MTEKDIDAVCSHLQNVPYEQLLPVCRKFSCDSRTTQTQLGAVASIGDRLRRIPEFTGRLFRVADLYAWLASLDVLKPWTLYGLDAIVTKDRCFDFLRTITDGMKYEGSECAYAFTETPSSVCWSILTTNDGNLVVEHRLVCLNLWYEHPFLAVHDAGALIVHAERLRSSLAAVNVDPGKCLRGYYEKLSSAHAKVSRRC